MCVTQNEKRGYDDRWIHIRNSSAIRPARYISRVALFFPRNVFTRITIRTRAPHFSSKAPCELFRRIDRVICPARQGRNKRDTQLMARRRNINFIYFPLLRRTRVIPGYGAVYKPRSRLLCKNARLAFFLSHQLHSSCRAQPISRHIG